MGLALFDLDNTLLGGDSDYLWGRFLVENGIVDADHYEQENHRFYQQYQAGNLDIQAFLAFSLRPLAEHPPERLHQWRETFIRELIAPIMLPAARDLLARHRSQGDTLVIITATNRFITAPIAERFGVEHLLATEVEQVDGRYTGHSYDIPCFQDGKVRRLEQWLATHDTDLSQSWFYSDSHNDLPLLERVTHPCGRSGRHPAPHRLARGWPVISRAGVRVPPVSR
ncbi:histidinol-phosphatase [Thiohalobacter thiocyanaticus]|uniref:HAD family hydrolase n=1 Tax=Thiohalobacter thiocyanaticus TaxID=585455 RepID=A0A426QL07_9GAMM|nr:HAD family hydrolase [Thiohalobacter thiocyanaticus]RRQ22419.1 HAD family hydrolase [Thiohalobacter thiocyanaticus]